jgi:hypothetical protein
VCFQDLFISAHCDQHVNTGVAMTTTAALLIPFNLYRVSLEISLPLAETLTLGRNENVTANNGLRLTPGSKPYRMTLASHQGLIRGPFFGILTANTETIGWAESTLTLSLQELIDRWEKSGLLR